MKIWSRTLTRSDLDEAADSVNSDFPGCAVWVRCEHQWYNGPRTRRLDGVSLCSRTSTRYRNPGTGEREYGQLFERAMAAASWTEWGWFLARVFDRDPSARCGDYRNRDDFDKQTNCRFIEPRSPRERQMRRLAVGLRP